MDIIKTGTLLTALAFISGYAALSEHKNVKPPLSGFRDAVKDTSDTAMDSLMSSASKFLDDNNGAIQPAPSAAAADEGSTSDMDGFFKYLNGMFVAPEGMPVSMDIAKASRNVDTSRAGPVAYTFKLGSMLNSHINSNLSFTTPHGVGVKLSGYTSSDCKDGGQRCEDKDKFFMVLAAGPNEVHFIKAMDVANALFMHGSRTIVIGGDELTVKLQVSMSKPPSSKIEITCGGAMIFSTTLKQLGDAVGADIRLGKTYKLAYGRELLQGHGGARFSDNLVVIMSPVGEPGIYFLNHTDITESGVTYPDMEQNFGFRIKNDVLEIFKLQ